VSIYKRISWGKEAISSAKLNDMVRNMDYLYEKMITGYYNLYGVARETGLTIRAGHAKLPFTEAQGNGVVHYFPRPFLPGSRPAVVTSVNTDYYVRFFHAIRGLDGRAVPDHRGFYSIFNQDRLAGGPTEFQGDMYYTYIALAPNG